MPAPYTEVQFIGFNIKPGTEKDLSGAPTKYLGDDDAEADMRVRCEVLKSAIREAYKKISAEESKRKGIARGVSNAVDTAPALKIFMAPEFYFRGADGAYPVDTISKIIPEMRSETDKDIYADWLFVFGTAIGYLKHGDVYTEIKAAEKDGSGNTVITVASVPHGDWNGGEAKEFADATIKDMARLEGGELEITLDADRGMKAGGKVRFRAGAGSRSNEFAIKAADKAKIQIDYPPETPCPTSGCRCSSHSPSKWRPRLCQTCQHSHLKIDKGNGVEAEVRSAGATITKVEEAGPGKYKLTLATKDDCKAGNAVYLKRKSSTGLTEILNVALVRKGANPQTGTGLREAAVYKEFISPIDYIGKYFGKGGEFHDPSGTKRIIDIHGDTNVDVMPTTGSIDVLGGRGATPAKTGTKITWSDSKGMVQEQRISEINKSGLGGGSVVTIDNVTYGVEVCLDHAKNRLYAYYNDHYRCPTCNAVWPAGGKCLFHAPPQPTLVATSKGAVSPDPKVQVLLIPSWGMTIGGGRCECLDGGLVFNVDGGRADSTLRVQDGKFGCDKHPSVVATVKGPCTSCRVWYCPSCYHPKTNDTLHPAAGNCPDCTGPLNSHDFPQFELKPLGTAVGASSAGVGVDMSAAAPRSKYFENDGTLDIFPIKSIPDAKTV